jgi:hypothetical protein
MKGRTEIGRGERLERSSEPVAVKVDGAVVMMSIEQEMYFGMEGTAGRIWELLASPQSIETLCGQLAQEFDVEPASCEEDVRGFLSQLLDEGLVRRVHAATAPTTAPTGA